MCRIKGYNGRVWLRLNHNQKLVILNARQRDGATEA